MARTDRLKGPVARNKSKWILTLYFSLVNRTSASPLGWPGVISLRVPKSNFLPPNLLSPAEGLF